MKQKIFIAAAVLFSSALHAQDSLKVLDEVVVTATKNPIKQSLTGKVITVINREQLEKSNGQSISEILNTQAGLIVNGSSNNLGTNQSVYMRGAADGKTLILVDGIPVYDAGGISGAFDLNALPVEQVERIEILRGSQSTLYGSDAIGGVINIITKKGGDKKIGASLQVAGGSYGTFKTGVGLNGTVAKTNYNVQFNTINSKGFSTAYDAVGNQNFDNDGFDQTNVRANINQKITDKFGLRLNTQFNNYKTDLDAGGFTDEKDYTLKVKNSMAGIGADYSFGKTALHFNYHYNTITRNYFDDSASRGGGFSYYSKSKYTGRSHFTELYSNMAVHKNIDILLGADYRNQQTFQSYFSFSSFGPYAPADLSDDSAKVNQLGIYASIVLKNLGGFNLEVGGRYNNFNKYGDVFTWSFNPSFAINKNIRVFSNISSGFKAPSLYQVWSPDLGHSIELKPEKSLSFDIGAQYSTENGSIRAAYFTRNIKDNLLYNSPGYPDLDFYSNDDKQKDRGFELETKLHLGKITLIGNYTNVDGKVETKVGGKDTAYFNLYRRPAQSINLGVSIDLTSNWLVRTDIQSISKRFEPVYMAAPIEMPSYYTWNLYTQYKIGKLAVLYVDLKNITDEQYFELRGYNSRRFNVMAGVNFRF